MPQLVVLIDLQVIKKWGLLLGHSRLDEYAICMIHLRQFMLICMYSVILHISIIYDIVIFTKYSCFFSTIFFLNSSFEPRSNLLCNSLYYTPNTYHIIRIYFYVLLSFFINRIFLWTLLWKLFCHMPIL